MLSPRQQKKRAASKKENCLRFVFLRKNKQIFSATRTCLAEIAIMFVKKAKSARQNEKQKTLLATLDAYS